MSGVGYLTFAEQVRILLSLLALVLLPGWAILAISGYWRRWDGLQRWLLAICFGLAFWPPFYYFARIFLPSVRIGFNKLLLLLVICLGLIIWKMRNDWRDQFKLGQWWWIVVLIMAVTFYFRFNLANQLIYPGWTDSLHHSILTELTATTGKLPYDMMPYDSASLQEYHLGLYAITAPVQILAKVPAHTALLWTAQFLNALCGVGLFLLLDKRVSRIAAIAGLITVCLYSFQPVRYYFWGRFTQLGAQTLLLAGVAVFWDLMEGWRKAKNFRSKELWTGVGLSALLFSSLALIHFRVAGYTLPLVLLVWIATLLVKTEKKKSILHFMVASLAVVAITFVLVSPALLPAIRGYLNPAPPTTIRLIDDMPDTYFSGQSYEVFLELGLEKGLVLIALLGGLVGLMFKKTRSLALVNALWCLALIIMGNLYRLGIGALAFTNITAVYIMAYLPAGIFVGILAESLVIGIKKVLKSSADLVLLALVCVAFLMGIREYMRIEAELIQKEDYRMFLQPADIKAMDWISNNTPDDALFAINTYAWLPYAGHGSDAGYWIPYFARRATISGTMISNFRNDYDLVLEREKWVLKLYQAEQQEQALDMICSLGVDYLYSGLKEPFTREDFDLVLLDELPTTELVYDQDGVQIMRICIP